MKEEKIFKEEKISVIEAGKLELWRIYTGPGKSRYIVKHIARREMKAR